MTVTASHMKIKVDASSGKQKLSFNDTQESTGGGNMEDYVTGFATYCHGSKTVDRLNDGRVLQSRKLKTTDEHYCPSDWIVGRRAISTETCQKSG